MRLFLRLTIGVVVILGLLPGVTAPALASQQPGATPVAGDPSTAPAVVIELALPVITEATCDAGPAVTAPPSTETVTYSEVTAVANGDGTHSFTYTATVTAERATLSDVLPEGYARDSDTLATYTITLPEAGCEPEMQAQASGGIGILANDSGTICDGRGNCVQVTVTIPATVERGKSLVYTVTFTQAAGNGYDNEGEFILDLPGAPADWTITENPGHCSLDFYGDAWCVVADLFGPGADTATLIAARSTQHEACGATIESDGGYFSYDPSVYVVGPFATTVTCPTAAPEDPGIVPGSCVDGAFVESSIQLPATDGITYDYAPKPLPLKGTVTVTATLEADYEWGDTDWTIDPDTHVASKDFTISPTGCSNPQNNTGWYCQHGTCLLVTAFIPTTVERGHPLVYRLEFTKTAWEAWLFYGFRLDLHGAVEDWTIIENPGRCFINPGPVARCALDNVGPGLYTMTFTVSTSTANEACGSVIDSPGGQSDLGSEHIYIGPFSTEVVCTASPEDPLINPGSCVDGAFIEPSIQLPDTIGIASYSVSPDPLPRNGAVTVTATLEPDHTWGETTGWTVTGPTASKSYPVSSTACVPDLAVTKTVTAVNGQPATGPVTGLVQGDVVTYQIVVANTGTAALADLIVTDPSVTDLACDATLPVASVAPNGTITCTATHTIADADLIAGSVTNTAAASGTADGTTVFASDAATVTTVDATAAITLEKTVAPAQVDAPGQVTYTFVIGNAGTLALDDLALTDDRVDLADFACDGGDLPVSLAPNTSVTCTVPLEVTQAMLDAGDPIENEATVTATASNQEDVTATDTATLTLVQRPAMTFAKTADVVDTVASVGDEIVYTFTIGNAGNVTLTGLTLTDTLPGLGELDCDTADRALPDQLATGASVDCTATYRVMQADLDAGAVTNAATAASDQTAPLADAVTVTAIQSPALTLEKSAATPEGEPVTTGTVITYTVTVTNAGTVTIEDIGVVDALPGLVWDAAAPGGAVGTLAPGESATLRAAYTVSDRDVAAGVVTNQAQASGTRVGCADMVTLRQESGDGCTVVSDVASVSVKVHAPATQTATVTPSATPTATKSADEPVAVSVLPATGHSGGPAGGTMAIPLLALAALLGLAAMVAARRVRQTG